MVAMCLVVIVVRLRCIGVLAFMMMGIAVTETLLIRIRGNPTKRNA